MLRIIATPNKSPGKKNKQARKGRYICLSPNKTGAAVVRLACSNIGKAMFRHRAIRLEAAPVRTHTVYVRLSRTISNACACGASVIDVTL